MASKQSKVKPVLVVVMDGVGEVKKRFGNAVALAHTPNLNYLRAHHPFTLLHAHGTHVGLPSDQDMGNSEVGHNALGAGRVYEQGAKLVDLAIKSGSLFSGKVWQGLTAYVKSRNSTLHFIGLLSDGNVHSHQGQLEALLAKAVAEKVGRIRIHCLLDGRDVGPYTAHTYAARLEATLASLRPSGVDIAIASGGGRMQITMDRYGADWEMLARGYDIHVKAQGPIYDSLEEAILDLREKTKKGDQDLPGFVIRDAKGNLSPINKGDGVVLFNFRGDRAIQLCQVFEDEEFKHFTRGPKPDVFFCGLSQYDGDLSIPSRYLVDPPKIENTLSEFLVVRGLRQFACSETQKYGHVTYFWNGNRSGYFDEKLEKYLEIPSDRISFAERPWMKAHEITAAVTAQMQAQGFDFARINFANGDMVGHTGDLAAAVCAVSTVDLMLGKLMQVSRETKTTLVITADHGNCDAMFDGKEEDFPDWEKPGARLPAAKTSHTLAPVPCFIFDPRGEKHQIVKNSTFPCRLSNIANTCLQLMGLETNSQFEPSLLLKRDE